MKLGSKRYDSRDMEWGYVVSIHPERVRMRMRDGSDRLVNRKYVVKSNQHGIKKPVMTHAEKVAMAAGVGLSLEELEGLAEQVGLTVGQVATELWDKDN